MTKKTPKFEALITNAIRRLQAAQGSTASEIARYLNKEYDISGPELRRQIQLTIRRGVNYGILQRSKRGYVTCDHNIPDVDPEDIRECTMNRRGRSRGRRHHRGQSRSRGRKGAKSRAGGRSRAGRKKRLARRGAIRHRRRRVMTTKRRARSRAASKMTRRRVRAEEVTVKRRRRPSSANSKMPQQEPPSPNHQRQQSPGQGQGGQQRSQRTPSKSPTRSDEYQQHHHNQQPPQQQRHTCHDHRDDSHLRIYDTPSLDGIEKLAIKCQHPLITKSLVTAQNEFCYVNP
ncbi:unnamed protein product [Trichogramma brassicae]|uniref:H15 domain-containing protein n=1 Tax=Trichogramma brassicae TaxID=86971 RepID=A0A6H5IPX2_9HYME|nr:unnamed protein product [Trichogramma brassicae]